MTAEVPVTTADLPANPLERNRRMKELFDAAFELQHEDRASFFDTHCGGDKELRNELEVLLRAVEDLRTSDVLPRMFSKAQSQAGALAGVDRTAPLANGATWRAQLLRGQTIGRFVVLGLVGRGGMGEVYAVYDPELDRRIAVKLLRARTWRSDDARPRAIALATAARTDDAGDAPASAEIDAWLDARTAGRALGSVTSRGHAPDGRRAPRPFGARATVSGETVTR